MNGIEPDGNLPAAKRQLADAIHALTGRTTTMIDGRQYWGDSLYVQLRDAVPGAQGTALGAVARSMPPMWVDASDLLNQIDVAVEAWQPSAGYEIHELPDTVRRLHLLEDRPWRPQDTRQVTQIGDACQEWANAVDGLLNPAPRWTLSQACPACDTKTVYRRDSAGETVRQAALQIGPLGCECQKCHTTWAPAYFQHLAQVLGYELPDGVLE